MVLGRQLDLMILEVFSNLNDSMILYVNIFSFSTQSNECLFHARQNRPRDWVWGVLTAVLVTD